MTNKIVKTFRLDSKVVKAIHAIAEKDNRTFASVVEHAVMTLANARLTPEQLLDIYKDSFIDKTKEG